VLVEVPAGQHAEGLEVVLVEDVDIVASFRLEVRVAEGNRKFVGTVPPVPQLTSDAISLSSGRETPRA